MSYLSKFIHLHEIAPLAPLVIESRADGFHFAAQRIIHREQLLLDLEYYIARTIFAVSAALHSRVPSGTIGIALTKTEGGALLKDGINAIVAYGDRFYFEHTNFRFWLDRRTSPMIVNGDLSPLLTTFIDIYGPKAPPPVELAIHRAIRAQPEQIGLFVPCR